ncbi:MAG: LPS export ABC transporter permease LptG [Candidatus Omnitrophica bacterium]|nr:LPS export ABC transporter permease LptG [Candidatus Omnitrophota bacterium]MCM8791074.1 LPS export ABC transporter permease LptG [Candidatus Omnitrophota bacterium]
MQIIDRYIIRGFVGPLIWCILIFIIMAIIIDIFSFIDDIVKYKIPLASIIAFYVYYAPTIFLQVTPMAVLLSTVFLLSNLNKHNELIAMKSSGISLWRIMAPLLVVGFIVSMAVFAVNNTIIPVSARVANYIRREEIESQKRMESPSKLLRNVALYGAGNRIIFARTYDDNSKTLNDIIIHEHDSKENLLSKITAQSGTWTKGGWKFQKVIFYNIDNAGRILAEPQFFEEKVIPIEERPSDFANMERSADYMSYQDLKRYIVNFQGAGAKLVRGLLVELHYKIAYPLISFIIILIGAPFAMITNRGGVLIGIGLSIALGLLYYAFIAIALAFGKAGILPPAIAAWSGNVVFAAWGIYLINKRA